MSGWIAAMRVSRGVLLLTALTAVLAPAATGSAQTTPLPVPTGPGGGAPIYVQPAPSPGMVPGQAETPEPARPGAPGDSSTKSRALPTTTAPAEAGKDSRQGPRQITAFPEMTRGIGNSQVLLGQ